MANVRFNLYRSRNRHYIYLVHAYARGKYLRYSIGEQIDPEHWDKLRHRVKSSHKRYILLNRMLNMIEDKCEEIKLEMKLAGVPLSEQEYKDKLDILLFKKHDDRKLSVFLSQYFSGKENKQLRSYNRKLLNTSGDVLISDIDRRFFDKIIENELASGNTYTYANKILSYAKRVIKKADSLGYEVNEDYRFVEKKRARTKMAIYLSVEELEQLYTHSYTDTHLRNAVLLWLLGAWTSLRVSDYIKLAKRPERYLKSINGRDVIDITSNKQSQRSIIPLHPVVREILSRKEYYVISPQKINKHIKPAAQDAGIDATVTRMEYPAGKRIEKTYHKYELISTHTGRRSFITNAAIAGIPKSHIMSISGHSTERQLNEYIKMSQIERYQQIAGHDFFKGL